MTHECLYFIGLSLLSFLCGSLCRPPYSTKADKTPPQEYVLPLAEGWSYIGSAQTGYSKEQFGCVHVAFALSAESLTGRDSIIMTLPEGYRPFNDVYASAILWTGYNSCHPSLITLRPDGTVVISHTVTGEDIEYISLYGQFEFYASATKLSDAVISFISENG